MRFLAIMVIFMLSQKVSAGSYSCIQNLNGDDEYILVDQHIDEDTGTTSKFDTYGTFTDLKFCKDAAKVPALIFAPEHPHFPADVINSYQCFVLAPVSPGTTYLVRQTRNALTGLVVDILRLNEFEAPELCRSYL